MGKFDSKRVLHVGSRYLTQSNTEYLKSNGAYVILADKYLRNIRKYKNKVDKIIKLDIDNNDKIIDYCKKNNIDAVFVNGTEPSYEKARILNEGIGNSYVHTAKQWQTFMNKANLKKLCQDFDINVPKLYYSGHYKLVTKDIIDSISYPVIIKPVDSAGGIGISVCFDHNKLQKAINYAGRKSYSNTILIEEYIEGREVIFTYVVQDGHYKLIESCDKYVYKDSRNLTCVPDLYIYPCADHDFYINNINDKVIKMLKNEGLNNCTLFFQTIQKDHKFYFFESGLRFEGTNIYDVTYDYTGQSMYRFYFDYLLKIKTDYDINKDDPKLNGHILAMFAVHLKPGIVARISGIQEIKNNSQIDRRYYFKRKRSIVNKEPLGGIFAAYCMDGSNIENLIKNIRFIKQSLSVKDYFNREMIIDSFDESVLLKRSN